MFTETEKSKITKISKSENLKQRVPRQIMKLKHIKRIIFRTGYRHFPMSKIINIRNIVLGTPLLRFGKILIDIPG